MPTTGDYVTFFDKGNPHHRAFLQAVLDRVTKLDPAALQDGGDLRDLWKAGSASVAPAAPEPLITMAQVEAVFLRQITKQQLDDLNSCLIEFSITSAIRIQHFLAQVGHESAGLKWVEELADGSAYEGRKDLGNTQPGDGPHFKGAGAIQLTGRANYAAFAAYKKDTKIMGGCKYVSQVYPLTSAGFWWWRNGMNAVCDSGASCREISRRVNGRDPANGLADREAHFVRAQKAVPLRGQKSPGVKAGEAGSVELPNFPYFSQLDNGPDGWRRCQTSSIAMCLKFLKIKGINDDLDYQKIVDKHGDTTDQQSHKKALAELGVTATFRKNMTTGEILAEIKGGRPVAVGALHKGHVNSPSGGGHYVAIYGATQDAWRVMDPYGEIDLIAGEWIKTGGDSGKNMIYSFRNFNPRIAPREEGPASAWGWTFS
jgi:predicted chitinase